MFYLFGIKFFLILGGIYLYINAIGFTCIKMMEDTEDGIDYKASLGLFVCAISLFIIRYAWLLR